MKRLTYFFDRKNKTQVLKEIEVFRLTGCKVKDSTGKEYQLYTQGKLQFVADFRITNPNVGVLIDKVFYIICTYEQVKRLNPETLEKYNFIELAEKLKNKKDEKRG